MGKSWIISTQGLHAMQVHHGTVQACHIESLQMSGMTAVQVSDKGQPLWAVNSYQHSRHAVTVMLVMLFTLCRAVSRCLSLV